MTETPHIAVLQDEIVAALLPDERKSRIQRLIDGTLGAGGHSRALLQHSNARVLAFDLDLHAIAIARATLSDYADRAHITHASYAEMQTHANAHGWPAGSIDGIALDLGVSSMQFDTAERGFAFRYDAPLDMRFDPTNDDAPTAAEIINTWEEKALANIFYRYGEEKHSRRIAKFIAQQRPINTTGQLAALIDEATPQREKRGSKGIHPATRVFQALRIAVNDELGTLEAVLPVAIDMLKSGGRLAVITFHSLEDRLVKQHFKHASTALEAPPGMASIGEKAAQVQLVNRKPILPTEDEIARNPRSRSAKLRIVEKL